MATTAHDDIASALGDTAPSRPERRRRATIAATFKPDEAMERMLQQLEEVHRCFDDTYGPHGRVMVGMYQQAKRAALDEKDAA